MTTQELSQEVREHLYHTHAVELIARGYSLDTACRKAIEAVDERLEANESQEQQFLAVPF